MENRHPPLANSVLDAIGNTPLVELGRSEAPGRPILYGTGFDFLERFGLTSLDDLPVLDSLVASRLVEDDAAALSELPRGAADPVSAHSSEESA